MTLMDDKLMHEVFNDRKCVEAVLQEIFHDSCLKITDSWTQEQLDNFFGKGTKMDVLAQGMPLIFYNIEPQENFYDARPERARYYGSIIDTKILESGNSYARLPPVYVIFITERDALGEGKALYDIERTVKGSGKSFGDGTHILFISADLAERDTDLGRLMEDLRCPDPKRMHYRELRDRVGYFKNDKEGRIEMSGESERILNKEIEKAVNENTQKERKDVARSLLSEGTFPVSKIAELSRLSVGEVEKLRSSINA